MKNPAVITRRGVFTALLLCMAAVVLPVRSLLWMPPSAIQVFAGADRVVCQYESIRLADLNATITGDTDDGDWFTYGDGRFQPGNLVTVRYSVARLGQVTYVPGPGDRALGFYRLMLMSDVPANNPQERVLDDVRITFQAPPPLFCTSNFTLSLDELCRQHVDITMLHPNPVAPYDHYEILLYDKNGKAIPGNILTREHINTEVTFRLGHRCTTNHCIGRFRVDDYYPPVFACRNDTLFCDRSSLPDSVGLPIPKRAVIDTVIQGKYIIQNWDHCSDVVLEYTDEVTQANCARNEEKTIRRRWTATDARGNRAVCTQQILIRRLSLAQVRFPAHYDGVELPAFECRDTFPVLSSGHPSPDTTGRPLTGFCSNLQFTMQDVRFDLCGQAFKVARSWFVIDWCTSESVSRLQIIVVKDSRPPAVICPDTLRFSADPYVCRLPRQRVPSLPVADDCSGYTVSAEVRMTPEGSPLDGAISMQGGELYISGLDVGQYVLVYTATDVCGNTASCSAVLRVEDTTSPSAVCHQFATVSLDNSGKARLFAVSLNDGSTDNCGIRSFAVRKLTGSCAVLAEYTDVIEFCCEEVGTSVMVELRVTDVTGLSNTCMVSVRVDDKLAPRVSCPPHVTISCSDNLDETSLLKYGTVVMEAALISPVVVQNAFHQGRVGYDGLATDNCQVMVSQRVVQDITCYTGLVQRIFTATDAGGLRDSCVQRITVQNPAVFSEEDIRWPSHFEGQGCRTTQTQPDITGRPAYSNTACATVAATFEDQSFYSADGACLKVFRSWTVVDWCQFDGTGHKGKFGPYTQIIKVSNTDIPVFTQGCRDTTICSYDAACQKGKVRIEAFAQDPCTPEKDLIWEYTVDFQSNGTVEQTGNGRILDKEMPVGTHTVVWRVADPCGNNASCRQLVEVKDCKTPSPYCFGSLTSVIDKETGGFAMQARDFDKGSADNCSPDLVYTFGQERPVDSLLSKPHYFAGGTLSDQSAYLRGDAYQWLPAVRSAAAYFSCADLPDGKSAAIPLRMTVWDAKGNSDYCDVILHLQDNNNVCPDQVTSVVLGGRISTEQGKTPPAVEVVVRGQEIEERVTTDPSGMWRIPNLPSGRNYAVLPSLTTDVLKGISTLDLVHIQRHILGLTPLTSAYQLIAADVNGSGSITASDLLELRRLLLGISTSFPRSIPSWVFVDKNNPFGNPSVPYQYNDIIETGIAENDMTELDFIAIKIGDVNQSAVPLSDEAVDRRDTPVPFPVTVSREEHNEQSVLVFRSEEDTTLDGFQLFLDNGYALSTPLEDIQSVDGSRFVNVFWHAGSAVIGGIAYSGAGNPVRKGDVLLRVPIRPDADVTQVHLAALRSSEVYHGDISRPISLRFIGSGNDVPVFVLQSNPVLTNPVLAVDPGASGPLPAVVTLYDSHGYLLSSSHHQFTHRSTIEVSLPDAVSSGNYFIRVSWPGGERVLPFVAIR